MDLFTQMAEAVNPTGKDLKELGIQMAIVHADKVVEQWSDKAYKHFIDYCKMVTELKTEDARVYAEAQGLEIPPTKRAWGAIPMRAAKAGIITRIGYVAVNNPKAHCTTVSLWAVIKDKINHA